MAGEKSKILINPSEDLDADKKEANQWKQLGLLFLGTSFFGNGTLGITKAVLSVLLKSMGFTGTEIGLISGARGFKAIADIPAGYVSDKYGRKKCAYIGQFLLIIAHWLLGLGHSFWSFFIARLIHGAGAGFNAGAATFGAADLLKRARGFGQGLLEMANYASQTVFAALTGFLILHYGMRAPFFLLGIAPLFGFYIVRKYMKEPRDLDSESPTAKGEALKNKHQHITVHEASKFVGTLLTNPRMLSVFYAGLLTKFVDEGLLTMLLPLWVKSKGFSTLQVASVATMAHGSFAATVVLSGYLSDKIGRKSPMVIGTLIFAAASLVMPFTSTMFEIAAVAISISIGNALVYPSAPAATADVVPQHLRATGMGVYKLVHDIGIFVGPVVMGLLLDHFGMSHAFSSAAAICLLGTLLLGLFY